MLRNSGQESRQLQDREGSKGGRGRGKRQRQREGGRKRRKEKRRLKRTQDMPSSFWLSLARIQEAPDQHSILPRAFTVLNLQGITSVCGIFHPKIPFSDPREPPSPLHPGALHSRESPLPFTVLMKGRSASVSSVLSCVLSPQRVSCSLSQSR